MNQNNNQLQQSNQVSQEELAKTQVLNLNDVQAIANFERKTSKRPAILFAIAGVLAIVLGFSYPNIIMAIDSLPTSINEANRAEPIELDVDENIANKVQENMISCVFTSPQNPDGTSGVATYNLVFDENELLKRYTMILTFAPLPGNPNGPTAIQNYYNNYSALDNIPVEGYEIATTYTDTGMRSISTVDLAKLNRAALTAGHTNNYFARVPFNYKDAKQVVTQQLIASGYVCE